MLCWGLTYLNSCHFADILFDSAVLPVNSTKKASCPHNSPFRAGLPATTGVILFRIRPKSPAFVAQIAVAALDERTDWEGHFSVIELDRIRMTPLPVFHEE